jgi:hypothetical protein
MLYGKMLSIFEKMLDEKRLSFWKCWTKKCYQHFQKY